MRITAINTNISIDSKRILKQLKNNKCKLDLGINAYIGEEEFDRHISINVCPDDSVNGFDIWLDLDIYQAELLSKKLDELVMNRKRFLLDKMRIG
jgi:hypothetical protein